LALGGRTFVLLGERKATPGPSERVLVAGGWGLELSPISMTGASDYTLVGPSGRCVAESKRTVALRLDMGGYSGASLPSSTRTAVEVDGCLDLAAAGITIALDGRDDNARWVHPAHVDHAPAPADRALGENEAWTHRFAVPGSELEVVERSVLRFVTEGCSDESRTAIFVDEEDHPRGSYPGFSFTGAIETRGRMLFVLGGHEDPEALKIVAADPNQPEPEIVLDARLAVFQDTTPSAC
jgi:hypothetical protein